MNLSFSQKSEASHEPFQHFIFSERAFCSDILAVTRIIYLFSALHYVNIRSWAESPHVLGLLIIQILDREIDSDFLKIFTAMMSFQRSPVRLTSQSG
jgi:hypothetical protein